MSPAGGSSPLPSFPFRRRILFDVSICSLPASAGATVVGYTYDVLGNRRALTYADGKVVNYAVEGGTPGSLYRQGWRKDSLRIGDTVTVDGFKAKNGTNRVNGRKVLLPDGSRVFGGSSDDGGPGAEGYGKKR